MKKLVLFIFSFLLLSVHSFADEVYFIDGTSDTDNLGGGGWFFAEDTAFVSKSEIVNEPVVEKKPVEIKIEYKDSDTGECTSVKKGCHSSR